jgi:membrane protein implicated in regulation of membrane protease activity
MNYVAQDRAFFASTGLMWLAIGFGCLSFWSAPVSAMIAGKSISENAVDWVIAAMLTAAIVFVSYLLSGSVTRFAEAKEKGFLFTAGMVVVLGAILCGIEAAMTHQGLAWLDARKDLAPDWALWIASLGLSAFNVFSLYTFARDLKRREKPETMAGKLLAMKSVQARRAA